MKLIKTKNFIAVIIAIIVFSYLVFNTRFLIKKCVNTAFPPSKTESINLSAKEKEEDFEYFYDTIVSSMASIDSYEEIYGFSFKDRKDLYKKLVLETNNDFEFYAVMDAICQEIPSFHTDILVPTSYNTPNCYNNKKISTDRRVISCDEYWDILMQKMKDEDNSKYYSFLYDRGEYRCSAFESSDNEIPDNYKIESINGISADQFITDHPSVFTLFYDGEHDKPCRTRIVFNNTKGTECILTLSSDNGETKEISLFADIGLEQLFCEKMDDLYADKNEVSEFYSFEGENVSYVNIGNLLFTNKDKIDELINNMQSNNVILDMRQNWGGYVSVASNCIYPSLFAEDITESNAYFIPESETNKVMKKSIFDIFDNLNKKSLKTAKDTNFNNHYELYQGDKTNRYIGKVKENKNVVILASHHTGSAADCFVHDMRKNGLAYVIGNNTGGEGLCDSFVESKLSNSNIVFIYFPGGAYTFENEDDSAYGTKPDYYLDTSESFISYLNDNTPDCFDDLYENDEAIRYACEYLMSNSR